MLVRVHLLVRDPPLQRRLRMALEGLEAVVTADAGRLPPEEALADVPADVVVVREDLLPAARRAEAAATAAPDAPTIVALTASEDAEHRSELIGRGATAVLGTDDAAHVLRAAFEEIVARRKATLLLELRARSAARHGTLSDFVAQSGRMERFVETVRRVIPQDTTVLVLGETGVGKERLARVIHDEGPRAGGPFVTVNCAALPDALLESELFGHEKGAFTDAVRQRRGRFELAHGGTVFLDEIGDMPLHLQVKLLRVLQEREVERLGGEAPLPVDIRVIAATNQDLKAAMAAKTFRPDLYYRLGVVTLTIPPLRDRPEDVPRLVETYLQRFAAQFNKGAMSVTPAALAALSAYGWPGNVRELINVVERAALLAAGPLIDLGDLPDEIAEPAGREPPPDPEAGAAWGRILPADPEALLDVPLAAAREQVLGGFEQWYLSGVLERTGGRVGDAARSMGIDPRSLYEKMRRHGLDKRDFRAGPPADD